MALSPLVTLEVKQGDTWRRTLTLTEDDDATPIDLTGASVEFSIATARGKTPSWTWVDDATHAKITDAPNGIIDIGLAPADSRAFGKLTVLPFEVTVTFVDGTRLSVLEGDLGVRLEVHNESVNP